MATNHGPLSRNILSFLNKHGNHLLGKAMHTYHNKLGGSGLRECVDYFAEQLGDQAIPRLQDELTTEQQVLNLVSKIKGNARDKLICTVFNDMARELQGVVMNGSAAQIYYFVNKYGLTRTQELVKNLLKK